MFIICFVGPDGSGKSTLARLLRGYLFSHWVYSSISWFRGSHLLTSLFARFLSRFAMFRGCSNPYYGISVPPKLKSAWLLMEFFSILPYYLMRRFLSLSHPVIGDRGVLDFVVWIVVTLDYPKFLRSLLGSFLLRLATVDVNVFVTADPMVLLKRARGTPRGFLLREWVCYNVLARYYASFIIDTTSKGPGEALGELLRCLGLP